MINLDWIAPAAVIGGGLLSYGALRQIVTDNRAAMVELITQNREDHRQMVTDNRATMADLIAQNREDHALLFDQIRAESTKREEGDEQIRREYVTLERCKDCPARESLKHSMSKADCRAYKEGRCGI